MKRKVKFFDKDLFNNFLKLTTTISVFFSFFTVIVDVDANYKIIVGLVILVLLSFIYIFMWYRANITTHVSISIENSTVEVKVGDIFNEDGLKVIGFNEYFDTIVDNEVISERSLNGIYIKNMVTDIHELDHLIEERLQDKTEGVNKKRKLGKLIKYKLGSIFKYKDEYLLTAFSKFDNDNRAYLFMNEYVNFLLNFWNEIDKVYAGKFVSIPLMGAGITRFKDYSNITEQDLLEMLIWSFKISRIKFPHPSKVSIIIHDSIKDKINFYKLREVV